MKITGTRRAVAVLAAAVVLGAGLAGCSGGKGDKGGKKDHGGLAASSGGSGGAGAQPGGKDAVQTDPKALAYADRLLAFLKTTPQGSHALRAEIFKERGQLYANIDTDLPYHPGTDSSDAAVAAREKRDKLAAEAEDWAYANADVDLELVLVYPAGRGETFADAAAGYVRDRGAEETKRQTYAARLLAHLKTTPYAALVTGAELDITVGQADLTVTTTLPSFPRAESFSDGARQAVRDAEPIAAAALAWTAKETEYDVASVVVEDKEKANITVVPR